MKRHLLAQETLESVSIIWTDNVEENKSTFQRFDLISKHQSYVNFLRQTNREQLQQLKSTTTSGPTPLTLKFLPKYVQETLDASSIIWTDKKPI
jgi:hypothetical protein